MVLNNEEKKIIVKQIADALSCEREVQKVVVFGSFFKSDDPNDIDIAVFQNSNETYIPLATKYRHIVDEILENMPVDIIPVRPYAKDSFFLREINSGVVIYER